MADRNTGWDARLQAARAVVHRRGGSVARVEDARGNIVLVVLLYGRSREFDCIEALEAWIVRLEGRRHA